MTYQFFVFFSAGFYYTEYLFLKRFIYLSFIFWISSIFAFNKILLPISVNFFLNFQNVASAKSVQMYFESKLMEYLNYYITFHFICGIYGQILLFLIFFLEQITLDLKEIKRFRKTFFLLFLLFATLITPPDIFSQIFLTFNLFLLYELLNFVRLTKNYCKTLIRQSIKTNQNTYSK